MMDRRKTFSPTSNARMLEKQRKESLVNFTSLELPLVNITPVAANSLQ